MLNKNKVTEAGGDVDGPQSWWDVGTADFCNLNLNHVTEP